MTKTDRQIAHALAAAESADVTETNGRRVTLVYGGGSFAHSVIEARLYLHGTRSYAQHDAAVWAIFTEKGKRKLRQIIQGYEPSLVVLDGWMADQVAIPSAWSEPTTLAPGLVVRETRAETCAEMWATEADAAIATAVASGAVILADYRRDPEP
jgi:hypothetical protein